MSIETAPARSLTDHVIGEILALMGRRRMGNAELGRRLGKPDYWVGRRLNGKIPIDLDDLQQIAGALGVSVTDLLPKIDVTGGREPTHDYHPGERVIATIGQSDRPTTKRRRPVRRTRPIAAGSSHPSAPAVI